MKAEDFGFKDFLPVSDEMVEKEKKLTDSVRAFANQRYLFTAPDGKKFVASVKIEEFVAVPEPQFGHPVCAYSWGVGSEAMTMEFFPEGPTFQIQHLKGKLDDKMPLPAEMARFG